jgi:hypothetical protein
MIIGLVNLNVNEGDVSSPCYSNIALRGADMIRKTFEMAR